MIRIALTRKAEVGTAGGGKQHKDIVQIPDSFEQKAQIVKLYADAQSHTKIVDISELTYDEMGDLKRMVDTEVIRRVMAKVERNAMAKAERKER